jgi:hypothetical protein
MKAEMIDMVQGALSLAGAAFNIALAAGFAWAAIRLGGVSADAFHSAGGLPSLSQEGLQALAADPSAPSRAGGYAVAWLSLVGSAGCAFMTALGARWIYHAAGRMLLRLKD